MAKKPPVKPATPVAPAAPTKLARGRSFMLNNLPDAWFEAQARAKSEGRSMRFVVLEMVGEYLKFGLRDK